jgi:cyanate permease
MACVIAGLVLVAAALVVRFMDERASTGTVLAAVVAIGLVVACLAGMAFMVQTANPVLWWQLFWSAGSAAVLGFGLTRVRSRRRSAEGRS